MISNYETMFANIQVLPADIITPEDILALRIAKPDQHTIKNLVKRNNARQGSSVAFIAAPRYDPGIVSRRPTRTPPDLPVQIEENNEVEITPEANGEENKKRFGAEEEEIGEKEHLIDEEPVAEEDVIETEEESDEPRETI